MDCQELNSQLFDYCDDSVSPQVYLKVSKHLKDCPQCQNLYQLTRLENEVLRDTSDIPALPADFTPRVMSSITALHRGPSILHNRKLWYGGLMAAAVFALFLYAPQMFKPQSAVDLADNSGLRGNGTSTPSVISTPGNTMEADKVAEYADRPLLSPPATGAGKDTSAPIITPSDSTFEAAVPSPEQTVPAADTAPGQTAVDPMLATPKALRAPSLTVPPETTVPSPLAASDGSLSTTVVEGFKPVVTPINVPAHLQLTQVDISDGSRTVYDYASPDGQIRIQITVDPYIAPEVKMQALDQSGSPSSNSSLARWVIVGEEMLTVTYSGNVPLDELTELANSVRFE